MHVRLPRAVLFTAALIVVAGAVTCAQIPDNAVFACDDGSCPSPLVCKAGFCVNDTCEKLTCEGLGKNCGTISDGCGNELQCGNCNEPETCGGNVPNVCSCVAQTTQTLCAEAAAVCGRLETTDTCGSDRTLDCGSCPGGQTCFSGRCCTPKSNAALCAERSLGCGKFTVSNCGVATLTDCGPCQPGSQCIHFDESSSCQACVPESNQDFCYRTGFQCGTAPAMLDNCGVLRVDAGCGPTECEDGRDTCGADGGTRCSCAAKLQNCSSTSQCCAGAVCGVQGLCCVAPGLLCDDDAQCCVGTCTGGVCPGGDGGSTSN